DESRLVDVNAVDDRTSTASHLTTSRRDFKTNVVERDGTCVITDETIRNCEGKRRTSVRNAVRHRGGTDDSADDINDIRNGLLLTVLLHSLLGAAELAFLKTPNFALTVDDIPTSHRKSRSESPASRLTLHYFVNLPQLGHMIPIHAPQNSDARQPQDTGEWPPAIIVDLFYAVAAMNA
ncbi:hypothetical protein F5887DRAFT_882206, partial [Amanita rubescens]